MSVSSSMLTLLAHQQALDTSVLAVKAALQQAQLIEAFETVAQTHTLSAPVVATMHATPGFAEAVANFPDHALYNIVPEHPSSARQLMGLEALSVAQTERFDQIKQSSEKLAADFSLMLDHLSETVGDLSQALQEAKQNLDTSELSNELLSTIHMSTLSETGFGQALSMLQDNLTRVQAFSAEDLRTDPELITQAVTELAGAVSEVGQVIGVTADKYGISHVNRAEMFSPTMGSLGEKGINQQMLSFFTAKAIEVCDVLQTIADNKDELKEAFAQEAAEVPQVLNSDETNYGANEHETLLCCYATLSSKLINEAVTVSARVLTAVDKALEAKVAELEGPAQVVSAE